MGFIPVQPRQTREMRERYRKARRRQQAQFLLLGCGALLLLAVILLIWGAIRRAGQPAAEPRPVPAAPPARPRQTGGEVKLPQPHAIRVSGEQTLSPGPWLLDADSESLYCLTDQQPFSDVAAYYTCDSFSARPLRGGKVQWEQQGEFRAGQLDFAGGMLIMLRESQSDKTLHLAGYNAASGEQAWTAEIAGAVRPRLYARDKAAIVTYDTSDGLRIACYNTQSGEKPWGLAPKFPGLTRSLVPAERRLNLLWYDKVIVYNLANVVGMINSETGKPLRNELTWNGAVSGMVIEEHSRALFVKVLGSQSGSSSIMSVPLGEGSARSLLSIQSADDRVFFAPGPDWLLAAWRRDDAGTTKLVLECKPLDSAAGAAESFRHELAGGTAICGALVPGSDSFLLGVAAESGDPAMLSGARQFYLVSPEQSGVREAGRTPQPAYEVVVFRDNLIALCDGGQLQRFDTQRQNFRLLKKLKYPQLGLLLSDDRTALLAWSSTEEYMERKPGQPLHAVVIR